MPAVTIIGEQHTTATALEMFHRAAPAGTLAAAAQAPSSRRM
jgi:hypothetical protein